MNRIADLSISDLLILCAIKDGLSRQKIADQLYVTVPAITHRVRLMAEMIPGAIKKDDGKWQLLPTYDRNISEIKRALKLIGVKCLSK